MNKNNRRIEENILNMKFPEHWLENIQIDRVQDWIFGYSVALSRVLRMLRNEKRK